jgi:site-specific DNA-cytosine methylase
MTNNHDLTAIELFSGAVGPMGVHNAGVKSLLAVDNWTKAQKAFEQNYQGEYYIPFLSADLFTLTTEEIFECTGLKKGELFLMISTSPCQGFSVAGKKDPFDYKNGLFLKSLKLVEEIKPMFFLLENVPGMAMPFNAPIFNEIVYRIHHDLQDYNIECRQLNALFYYANQSRERLIWIGVRKDLNIAPPYPEPDIEGANERRIRNLLPYIDGIYCGQSEKRLNLPDSVINTVTAGECFQILEKGVLRPPTIEELKIIVGLPEWFSFEGLSHADIHTIIGNAVPVQFMQSLVQAIKDAYLNSINL